MDQRPGSGNPIKPTTTSNAMSQTPKNPESVPKAMQPRFEALVGLTDELCAEHLNAEYADLCRRLTAALCRKRPSPLERGRLESWAAGIVYALGSVNFLFDPSQQPHMSAGAICAAFGVSPSTGAAKAKQIRDLFGMVQGDPRWCRPSQLKDNPLAWLIEVDGLVQDARHLPRPLQEEAHRRGLIPYVPDARGEPLGSESDLPKKSNTEGANPAPTGPARKMSEILKEMAETLLRNPDNVPSSEASHIALLFANAAWNECVGLGQDREGYRHAWETIEAENPAFWNEFTTSDVDAIMDGLVQYKQAHYPDDRRRVLTCGTHGERVRVEWLPPAAPGVDSRWEMQLYGLVRVGERQQAIRFLQETRGLSRQEATKRVAKIAAELGMA
jgi:hypothetical protein